MKKPWQKPSADPLTTLLYRPNVAAIVQNPEGQILVCERSNIKGAWQFPQGGLKRHETPEEGLAREIREEISLEPQDYRIHERRGPYRYLFSAYQGRKGYHGQEQQYFRVELLSSPDKVNVATAAPEFQSVRWIKPADFRLSWLPEMKYAVYQQVLRDFFGVEIT